MAKTTGNNRTNYFKSRAKARAGRLESLRWSWQGISTWYNWNSLQAWIEQQRGQQFFLFKPPANEEWSEAPLEPDFVLMKPGPKLHGVIRQQIHNEPGIIGLWKKESEVFEEPVCRSRNNRVVVCAPDLVFIYPNQVYLVEIKSSADETGLREQLRRDLDYFNKRFHIQCQGIGVYLEEGRLRYFHEPEEWIWRDGLLVRRFDLRSLRILVVDEDERVRYLLRHLFEAEECSVVTLNSGQDALEHTKHHPFDMVVMDADLPNVDYLQIHRNIAKIPSSGTAIQKLILMTKNVDASLAKISDWENLDHVDFIHKPLNIGQLLNKVRNTVRQAIQGKRTR